MVATASRDTTDLGAAPQHLLMTLGDILQADQKIQMVMDTQHQLHMQLFSLSHTPRQLQQQL